MASRKFVLRKTLTIALGEILCCGLMVGIYALLGRFSAAVILGAGVGAALATLNFFLMALGADIAADKGENQDQKGGQALIQLSYLGRMLGLFLILVLCAKSGAFDLIALVLPLVFVRPILTVSESIQKKGGDQP